MVGVCMYQKHLCGRSPWTENFGRRCANGPKTGSKPSDLKELPPWGGGGGCILEQTLEAVPIFATGSVHCLLAAYIVYTHPKLLKCLPKGNL